MNEKALTVIQPYPHLQCMGIKDIENRKWKTKFRGRVFIHAGANKSLDHTPWNMIVTDDQWKDMLKYHTEIEWCKMEFIKFAIVGSVEIVDCVESHPSEWALPDQYHWVLANPVLFDKPILDVKGKLSLWDCSKYIHSELDEDGKPICMCNLGIDEKDQVYRLFEEFRCKYCDGKWYK